MKISLGDQGKEVRDIQSRLLRLKYDLGTSRADGVYGEKTEEAVKNFQARSGLSSNGIVDDITWQRLFEESLFLGERLLYLHFPYFRGGDVRELQVKLVSLGFNSGPVDGIFGPKTERALKEFQQSVGLIVDGICGPETLAYLERFKGRQGNQKEVLVYPPREIASPFPPDLKIVLFVESGRERYSFLKDYLNSLAERLLRVFSARGISCYLGGGLGPELRQDDLLLVFEISKAEKNFPQEGLLLSFPGEGPKAEESKKLVECLMEKLKHRFSLLDKDLLLEKQEKSWDLNVLAVCFSFIFQRQLPALFSGSEENQQRLAGAISEGIKDYFAKKNK